MPGEEYLPPRLAGTQLYEPKERGAEQRIAQKLAWLRGLDAASDWHRRDEE